MCSIFSFAGILSVDLGWAADKNEAGFVAGCLQSSNTFGRIFTSALWGWVAEPYGVKLVYNWGKFLIIPSRPRQPKICFIRT